MKHTTSATSLILLMAFAFYTPIGSSQENNRINSSDNDVNSFSITKEKEKDPCAEINRAIRNIRAVKQLTQELDKYNNKSLFECLTKLAKDPSIRAKLKLLKPYLDSRKQQRNRPIR